eukprot:TRINITY_DN219_c0_g1_i2.p1 TRINITY_DN219_c0_g1~~TRINITY_DN219_c0_g1_i2.p1  ORF type:complete len:255 (-),score=30.16 TRINITY_DN219_c0_g1_i2:69-833(-)
MAQLLSSIVSTAANHVSSCTRLPVIMGRSLATSTVRPGLEEFFEKEDNLGKTRIRVGRSWRLEELRLKSNTDLHKLWYVLLKERNMLLTMEHAYKEAYVAMPNDERIDKVAESMENLEEVVKERNRAYYQLECGVTGERDRFMRRDALGRFVFYKPVEHSMPSQMNTGYRKTLRFRYGCSMNEPVKDFLGKYSENINFKQHYKELLQMREAARVVRRFPEVDMDALVQKYPLVNPERLMRWKKIRGQNTTVHDA